MITFKPYIHIVKIKNKVEDSKKNTYRVHILALVINGYAIKSIITETSPKPKIRLRVGKLKNNRHNNPEEHLVYLDGIENPALIDVIVESKTLTKKLTPYVIEEESYSDGMILLGRSVGSTEGVEEEEDDREGMEKKTGENSGED